MKIKTRSKGPRLFQRIVEIGMLAIDADFVRKGLAEQGRNEEDVKAALQLMACIILFDLAFFSKKQEDIVWYFAPHKNEHNDLAGYCSPEQNQAEGYVVYIEGITRGIEEECRKGRILLVNEEDGRLCYDEAPHPSFEEIVVGVAVHEVRHRLQEHGRVRIFQPRNIRNGCSRELRTYIQFIEIVSKEEESIFRQQDKPEDFIAKRTKPTELDARVVEEIAMARFHTGANIAEIYRTIKLSA